MPSGFPRSPKLIKGALIELTEPFLGPVPNIIVFQYNPEKIDREMKPWSAAAQGGGTYWDELQSKKQPFDPAESFSLSLELDAADALETSDPVAVASGVADRIAALEMLLYPAGKSLLGESIAKVFGETYAPRSEVPIVLFVWGPGRILPVRLTKFSVDEQAYSPALYPIRATVTVGLDVLTAEAIKSGKKPDDQGNITLTWSEKIAVKAYEWTRKQKEVLARVNLANTAQAGVEQIISEVI